MLIDRRSTGWIIACAVVAGGAATAYAIYARSSPHGPSGGSTVGLIYGFAGFAMMLFALLLGARRRVRTARLGRASIWLQGHVWIGLLSYPIVLMHAGMHFGGPLTSVLMWLFTFVVISGVFGLMLQQVMPTQMARDLPMERMLALSKEIVHELQLRAGEMINNCERHLESGALAAAGDTAILKGFYSQRLEPFLRDPPADRRLCQNTTAQFDELRRQLPPTWVPLVADLQQIMNERRQLITQARYQRLLHGWLLIHVPLSYLLMLLAAYHAVYAFRYVQ
jgi:hypothetical protein